MRTCGYLATATGKIEYLVEGDGDPVTVVGHGLTRTIADTRPLVRGVAGTMILFHFRGHGNSAGIDAPWTYDVLADDLDAVVEHFAVRRAVMFSIACGVLARAAVRSPDQFERLVFVLPPSVFTQEMSAAAVIHDHFALAAAGRTDELAALIAASWPAWMRQFDPQCRLARLMAEWEVSRPSVINPLRKLVRSPALTSVDQLRAIRAPTLVIGQDDDLLHPIHVTQALVSALPHARQHVVQPVRDYAAYGRAISAAVAGFLNTNEEHDGGK